MKTFSDIIDMWPKPSIASFAEDIGVVYVTAQVMRHRDSINSKHWDAVVAAAKRRGIEGVSLPVLAAIKSSERDRRPRIAKRRSCQPAA